jgi:hypothetical protein
VLAASLDLVGPHVAPRTLRPGVAVDVDRERGRGIRRVARGRSDLEVKVVVDRIDELRRAGPDSGGALGPMSEYAQTQPDPSTCVPLPLSNTMLSAIGSDVPTPLHTTPGTKPSVARFCATVLNWNT